jgi:hypothetical protein
LTGTYCCPCDGHVATNPFGARHLTTAWGEKTCQELICIGKQYLCLAEGIQRSCQSGLPTKLLKDAVHRTELHAHRFGYLDKMITTQIAYEYNYFTKKDTEASIEISKSTKNVEYLR